MANPKKGDALFADGLGKPMGGLQQTTIADHSITYGTDNPGLTAADATAIADGDATIVLAEMLQLGTDLSAKINAIIAVLDAHGLTADS